MEGQPEGLEEGQIEGIVEGEGEDELSVTLRIGFAFSRYNTVPVELLATNNPPARLVFDLYFDSPKFSLVNVEKGPSLTSAGKTLEAVSVAPGCQRITISDTEKESLATIPPGVLMYLRFDVVDHCFIIGTELSGRNGEAQDAQGRAMEVNVTSGFITDEVPCAVEGEGGLEGDSEGGEEGEGVGEGPWHSADTNFNNRISLSELLRVIQFFNVDSYHCQAGTEDGFAPGPGGTDCTPHASDYIPQNWMINLYELLRLIQFLNSNGYHACENSEDGFCPGLW